MKSTSSDKGDQLFQRMFAQSDFKLDAAAFQQWEKAMHGAPDNMMIHAKHCVMIAIREELTYTQKLYVTAYFIDGLNMQEIGEKYGVNKSTISRTIARGEKRLFRVLRYSNPRFIKLPMPKIRHTQVGLGIRPSAKQRKCMKPDPYLLKED